MSVQEPLGLTGCLDDVVCSANGSSTPGLRSSLAYNATNDVAFQHEQTLGRFQQLPSFRSSISFRAGQPVPTFHPHYLSVYASTLNFGWSPYINAATLDTEPLARSYSGGILPRSSSNHFQYARSTLDSTCGRYQLSRQRNEPAVRAST